jgi:hypothetical protein
LPKSWLSFSNLATGALAAVAALSAVVVDELPAVLLLQAENNMPAATKLKNSFFIF